MFFWKKTKRPDYEKLFASLISRLETIDRSEDSVRDILKGMLEVISATSGSVFLYQPRTRMFLLHQWLGERPLSVSVSGSFEFLEHLKNKPVVTFKDEIMALPKNSEVRSAGIHYFIQLSCAVAIPMVLKGNWIGVLNLGRKESGNYRDDEKALLALMGHWLGHHLSNVSLFREVEQQNRKLAELTELKSELLTNVTHELRTPLHGILGLTDLMLEGADGPTTPEMRGHLEMIKSAGDSLLELVNNILSLVQVEAHKGRMDMKRLDLMRLAQESAALYREILHQKGLTLALHLQPGLVAFGDDEQVRTVLMNLLGNAVKFTEKGQVEVLAVRSGDMVRVAVRDTGIGIPDDQQEKIFEDFRQASSSLNRAFGGAGLGLALAKKIVELHGGRIGVHSIPGKGSEFFFTLPLHPAEVGERSARA